jgi:Ser/Thr protein kinase RdoA (MazF antagonist)
MTQPEPENLRQVLNHWKSTLGEVLACTPLDAKGTVYRITAAGGREYVLKRVDQAGFARRLAGQFPLMLHLASSGVPVAVPIAVDRRLGQFAVDSGPHKYWLSTCLPARCDDARIRWPRLYATNTGAAIASLHRALLTYPHPIDSWKMDLPHKMEAEDLPLLLAHLPAELQTASQPVFQRIQERLGNQLAGLPEQHIHGDCHGGNIVFDNHRVSGFIDLDHLPLGLRVYDLAYFLADMAKNRFIQPLEIATWFSGLRPYIRAYHNQNPLAIRERQAIPILMLVTQVLFAAHFLRTGDLQRAIFNLDALLWLLATRQCL